MQAAAAVPVLTMVALLAVLAVAALETSLRLSAALSTQAAVVVDVETTQPTQLQAAPVS